MDRSQMSHSETQSSELLQTVFDNVGVAIAVVDNEGKFVFANQAALAMFGVDSKSRHVQDWGRSYAYRGYRFQDSRGRDIPMDGSAIMRALAGEQVEPEDLRVTFPDGTYKWLHTSTHRFSVAGLRGVLVIASDDTAEVELRNAATQVQRLETFAGVSRGLAHDFNNVLDVISSHAYLAELDAGVPGATLSRLQEISLASRKAADLVRRLMQFARTRDLQMRPVQINEVITGALRLVRPLVREGITVQTNLSSDLPIVEADAVEMEQVLVNLIVNALEAMPHGGELTIITAVVDADADITAQDNDQTGKQLVLISVSDTGVGIPQNLQSRIFEPFFTTKPAAQGTGLGLSSVYGIVRQHGGDIKLQSAPGEGATFSIFLPASS